MDGVDLLTLSLSLFSFFFVLFLFFEANNRTSREFANDF